MRLDDLRLGLVIPLLNARSRAAARAGDAFGQVDAADPTKDPHPVYAAARRTGPLWQSSLGPWVATTHAAASAVLLSPAITSTWPAPEGVLETLLDPRIRGRGVDPFQDSFLSKDAPEHGRLRGAVQPRFLPRATLDHAAGMRRVAEQLVARFPRSGAIDLVRDYARPLPMRVITALIGVPAADEERFDSWGEALAGGLDRPRSVRLVRSMRRAIGELDAFFRDLLERRRADPQEDLVSMLAAQGECTEDDRVATLGLMLIAGFETTVNLLGAGTLALLRNPEQLEALGSEPARAVSGLVEEALRFTCPVQYTFRLTRAPLEVEGAKVPAAAEVLVLLAGANRDPAVFADPDRFDIRRANARQHLAFATGPHHCLGAPLARMEAAVAWQVLLEAFPDVSRWRLRGEPAWGSSPMVRGLRALPMSLR